MERKHSDSIQTQDCGERCGYDLILFSTCISIILKLKKFFIYFEVDAHTTHILLLEEKLLFSVIPLGYPSVNQGFIDFY